MRSIHAQARAKGIRLRDNRGVKAVRTCTVLKPAGPLYTFWRNLENVPQLLKCPVEILPVDGWKSRWLVSAEIGGERIGWNVTLINDRPDRLIAWRSEEGAPVPNAGTIRFEPAADRIGTKVTVQLEYDPAGGKLKAFFDKLTGSEPGQLAEDVLERFKTLMETGALPAKKSGTPARV